MSTMLNLMPLADCTSKIQSLHNSLQGANSGRKCLTTQPSQRQQPSPIVTVVSIRVNNPYAANVIGTLENHIDDSFSSECPTPARYSVNSSVSSTPTKTRTLPEYVAKSASQEQWWAPPTPVSKPRPNTVVLKSRVTRKYHNGRPVPVLPDGTPLFVSSMVMSEME